MPETKLCPVCKGRGFIECFINEHDDETTTIVCRECGGHGEIHVMTEKEEQDYWEDYW